jgi:DNA mismatch repair protein MutS2
MKLYPESAIVQLEFEKIRTLLADHTRSAYAHNKALDLRIHTRLEYIARALDQSAAYLLLLQNGQYFPNDTVLNIEKELRLLGIPGAVLKGDDFVQLRRLASAMEDIFRWFEADRQEAYPALYEVVKDHYYEPYIRESIDAVMDETGQLLDDASPELAQIRMSLYRKRNEVYR